MKRPRSSDASRAGKRLRPQAYPSKKETDFDFIARDDYFVVGKLMYVRPYVFEFRTNFKPRWKDKTVFDVFCYEFRHAELQYWMKEFEEGRVLCRGEPVCKTTIWEDGMEVIHIVHRHESAVLSQEIHVANEHEGFVVVSKPSSIPVHPCGTYRRNSLQFILRAFHGMQKLHAVHRLDKETSGLVILAKNSEYAARFSSDIKHHKFRKTYIAEVRGIVPWETKACSEPIYWDKRELRASIKSEGAEASTSFRRVSVNVEKQTSIIECEPLTGRTHQIRVHLTHLGFPIVNDTVYTIASLPDRAQITLAEEPSSLTLEHPVFDDEDIVNNRRTSYKACDWSKHALEKHNRHLSSQEEGRALCCSNCPQVTNMKNVEVKAMFIHLHALKYESQKWSFEVPLPPWALPRTSDYKEKTGKSVKCSIA